MNLGCRTDVEQSHGLHITTELAQGISVLQMSAVDLYDYVRECIDENPFFDSDAEGERPEAGSDSYRCSMSSDALLEMRGHGSPERFGNERADMSQREFSVDRYLVAGETLEDYLLEQIRMMYSDAFRRSIGTALVGFIDERGYLSTPLLCIASSLGASEQDVLAVLEDIQHLEPIGIGSRSLAECLRLQLESRGLLDTVVEDVLDNHLDEFASRSPAAIAKSMGVSLQELTEVLFGVGGAQRRFPASRGKLKPPSVHLPA